MSRQTVSRVVNGSELVAPETRHRVLAAMHAIGYHQNRIASSLRSGRTRTIGFVLSNVMNPFFAAELRGAQDVVERQGYRVLVCNTDEDQEREQYYLEALHEQRVDGALVVAVSDASEMGLRALVTGGTRVVVLNRLVADIDSLSIDHPGGIQMATEHLIGHGHRRIGLVLTTRYSGQDSRVVAYRGTLAAHGIAAEPALVVSASERTDDVRARVAALLRTSPRPTGLVSVGYIVTLGVLGAAAGRGLRLPDDVGLVANTRTAWAPFVQPALTTVSGDPYALGVQAARVLLARIEDNQGGAAMHTSFPNSIDVRASCGPHGARTTPAELVSAPSRPAGPAASVA